MNSTIKNSLALVLFVFVSCSGSDTPAVGSGAAFSTFSTSPTGAQFWDSLWGPLNTVLGRLAPPQGSVLSFAQSAASASRTLSCPSGGTIALSAKADSSSSTAGTLSGNASFHACALTIQLANSSYNEVLDGSESVLITAEGGTITKASDKVGLSISGDIGASMVCNMDAQLGSDGTTYSRTGSCVFLDSEGTQITVTVDELHPVFEVPIFIANPTKV